MADSWKVSLPCSREEADRLKEDISELAQLDSPPVLAVADASVLANGASGVIFVVGADQTSRHTAKAAVDQLNAVQAHVIGAVLNKADVDRNPYYYSTYYRKEYSRYYAKANPRA